VADRKRDSLSAHQPVKDALLFRLRWGKAEVFTGGKMPSVDFGIAIALNLV